MLIDIGYQRLCMMLINERPVNQTCSLSCFADIKSLSRCCQNSRWSNCCDQRLHYHADFSLWYLKLIHEYNQHEIQNNFSVMVPYNWILRVTLIYITECAVDKFHFFDQTRSDWYIHTVLYTLPWVGKCLYDQKETDFNKILVSIQNYLGKRSKTHLHALKVWTSDSPHVQEDVSIKTSVSHQSDGCHTSIRLSWNFYC